MNTAYHIFRPRTSTKFLDFSSISVVCVGGSKAFHLDFSQAGLKQLQLYEISPALLTPRTKINSRKAPLYPSLLKGGCSWSQDLNLNLIHSRVNALFLIGCSIIILFPITIINICYNNN